VSHWFEPVADHLGAAYLRYSFTKGTEQEVEALVDALALHPGRWVLDVGGGLGRHAHALARRGLDVVGVDISDRFVALAREGAPAGATFVRADARHLAYDGEFDAAISLCQGAFGLVGAGPGTRADLATRPGGSDAPESPDEPAHPDGPGAALDPDGVVLAGMARALRPGGRLAVSAFSAYFVVRFLEEHDTFDPDRGVNHERTTIRDEAGVEVATELWTSCFTPRELRLLAAAAGLVEPAVWGVAPGDYAERPPDLDRPEFLLLASRPRGPGPARTGHARASRSAALLP
jgi:SAM-dependent methyltransferase